jgi:hypothetical protein
LIEPPTPGRQDFKGVPEVVPLLDSANRDRVMGTGVFFCPVATVLGKILVVRLEDIVFDPPSWNAVAAFLWIHNMCA